MRQRLRICAAAVVIVGGAAACAPPADVVRSVAPPASGEAPGGVRAQACAANEGILTTAIEYYLAKHASPPLDQQQLVDDGLLREVVPGWTIEVSGATPVLVAIPGGGCS